MKGDLNIIHKIASHAAVDFQLKIVCMIDCAIEMVLSKLETNCCTIYIVKILFK